MKLMDQCSGDDPPCMGAIQPLEVHPWRSSRVVRRRGYRSSRELYHCKRSESAPRYVKHGFSLCALDNRIFDVLI